MLSDAEWECELNDVLRSADECGAVGLDTSKLEQDRAERTELLQECLRVSKRWVGSCCPDPKFTTSLDDERCSDCLELAALVEKLEAVVGKE